MDTTHYWPFGREYSVWNAAVAALQFWTADLDSEMLSNAIEWVYTAFFCHNPGQHLRNMSEEILFSSRDSNTLHARTEHHSPVEHPMAHHLTSADKEKKAKKNTS